MSSHSSVDIPASAGVGAIEGGIEGARVEGARVRLAAWDVGEEVGVDTGGEDDIDEVDVVVEPAMQELSMTKQFFPSFATGAV